MLFNKHHLRLVPHLDHHNALVFDIIEHDLYDNTVLNIGRFTDRSSDENRITFKSKVVSRKHAAIYNKDSKFYIVDIKSSSGTYVNRARLSLPNQESQPCELKNGDIIQLGVDYQGGQEEQYRCVKMRVEINQPSLTESQSAYCLSSFKSLRNLASNSHSRNIDELEDCCICLYAIAPFQALFVAPCSHSFHFKCCYPLLNNYPGFTCPLCRSYADLNADVAIETNEVAQMLKLTNNHNATDTAIDTTIATTITPTATRSTEQCCSSSSSSPSSPSTSGHNSAIAGLDFTSLDKLANNFHVYMNLDLPTTNDSNNSHNNV